MPEISQRAKNMPASPVRKLVPYAEEAKKKGTKVYHLNIGQPDIETPETALRAIKNIDLKVLDYSLSEGGFAYREALASYYHKLGFNDLTPENFIVTNGGSEALNFAISTLCDSEDEVIIPEPYYANYNGFAGTFNVKVVAIPSTIENGFSLPPAEDFEKKITEKTRAIIICNPGNPTGYLYTQEELKKLAEIAVRHDIAIISDEVYREYVYDNNEHISMLAFPFASDHVVIIDSESKRYSMCGARIGCLITRSEKIYRAAMLFAQARLSPVLIGQIAATAAHHDDAAYVEEVRNEYTKRRDLLVDLLAKIPGVKCSRPKGAFYCVAELPVEDTDHFAQWLLEKFSDNNETVMVAPAGGFYSNPELGKKQVRIAYVLKEEDLKRSVELLEIGMARYKKEFLNPKG
ncbi:MAG: pyridoxal phosphate-dependent aminotransferase [Bergeyella sp.]|nr:pyridoxal phosphate-dependent aminotransferase [Bergeyella sp.]